MRARVRRGTFLKAGIARWGVERRQRRGASGAPIVEKHTERGQGVLLGLDSAPTEPETGDRYHSVPIINAHLRAYLIKLDRFLSRNAPFRAGNRIFRP